MDDNGQKSEIDILGVGVTLLTISSQPFNILSSSFQIYILHIHAQHSNALNASCTIDEDIIFKSDAIERAHDKIDFGPFLSILVRMY